MAAARSTTSTRLEFIRDTTEKRTRRIATIKGQEAITSELIELAKRAVTCFAPPTEENKELRALFDRFYTSFEAYIDYEESCYNDLLCGMMTSTEIRHLEDLANRTKHNLWKTDPT